MLSSDTFYRLSCRLHCRWILLCGSQAPLRGSEAPLCGSRVLPQKPSPTSGGPGTLAIGHPWLVHFSVEPGLSSAEALPQDEKPDLVMAERLGLGNLVSSDHCNPMLACLHSNAASVLLISGLNKRLVGTNCVAISAAPDGKTSISALLGSSIN